MLMGMTDKHKIRNMSEAAAAKERANRTMLAMAALAKEVRPGISERERADKKQEIDRLRKQHKREREPVEAFYKEFVHKAEELVRKREELARKFQ
jgi:predicted  nucleic acid-binding Zn-ribbon protein